MHRDISEGNILLAREDPSRFNHAETRTITLIAQYPWRLLPTESIQLVRRKPTQGNIYGLLHDMDMAAAVSSNDNDIVESLSLNSGYVCLTTTCDRRTKLTQSLQVVRANCIVPSSRN